MSPSHVRPHPSVAGSARNVSGSRCTTARCVLVRRNVATAWALTQVGASGSQSAVVASTAKPDDVAADRVETGREEVDEDMTVIHTDTDLGHWSREYWLGHCEGFRVEDDTRRLGIVDEVVGAEDEPEALVVRGGLFANRVHTVPVGDVLEIEPRVHEVAL